MTFYSKLEIQTSRFFRIRSHFIMISENEDTSKNNKYIMNNLIIEQETRSLPKLILSYKIKLLIHI